MASRKIGRWSNRIEIVDGFLKTHELRNAKAFALNILEEPDAEMMLTENELEYLRLVVSLETLDKFIRKKDKDDDI